MNQEIRIYKHIISTIKHTHNPNYVNQSFSALNRPFNHPFLQKNNQITTMAIWFLLSLFGYTPQRVNPPTGSVLDTYC